MFFTQEDYRKIEDYLKRKSIKDTEFNSIYELDFKDFIPVIHNNNNCKISVRDVFNGIGKNNVINYHEYINNYNTFVTLEEVLPSIKTNNRIPGSIITFIDKNTKQWETYQYNSYSNNNWLNTEYWRNLYDKTSNKFKGFFISETLLYKECLIPYVGDYAYVGNTLGEALIYVCKERGVWSKTYEMIISNSAALLK